MPRYIIIKKLETRIKEKIFMPEKTYYVHGTKKIWMITNFSPEIIPVRNQWNNIFKVQEST